ncbi:hypothetical protein CANCADRAFT_514 [Tortispora caseinolytica NRRL Y-17796]|uniref:Uncharacterized protein n=1 Tax=Tortispora caseinolytica NRRL Y-17796 TaxID=767744 RepID=A0A1E4TJT2_9ASCO|nr:hypothetical protein CANCADRAFT_514 [Tortispora caseinolytica NRRL Y-17796]
MGAQQSRSSVREDENTRVLLPQVPLELSSNLLADLDSSIESSFARSQYTEQYIQKLVTEALAKQHADVVATFTAKQAEIDAALSQDKQLPVTSPEVAEKLAALKQRLEARPRVQVLDDKSLKAKENLVKCLDIHAGQPMRCLTVAEEFKSQVDRLIGGL